MNVMFRLARTGQKPVSVHTKAGDQPIILKETVNWILDAVILKRLCID